MNNAQHQQAGLHFHQVQPARPGVMRLHPQLPPASTRQMCGPQVWRYDSIWGVYGPVYAALTQGGSCNLQAPSKYRKL